MLGDLSQWKVEIRKESVECLGDRIYIYRECEGDDIQIMRFSENGDASITTHKRNEVIQPSLILRYFGLIKSFGDAIAELGIKTDSDMKREGVLEATKEHLADTRKMIGTFMGMLEKGELISK